MLVVGHHAFYLLADIKTADPLADDLSGPVVE